MPCQSDDRWWVQSQANEADRATRVACDLVKSIRSFANHNLVFERLHSSTRKWIKKHDKLDEQRRYELEERKRHKHLKRKALKKLSKDERKALGIRP